MTPSDDPRTPIVARRCSERCWRRSFSGVGIVGRCRRKSGTCWIEWSSWWPDYPRFSQSAAWNPNRLEQLNGRIDRHGQKSKTGRICHFVGKGYNDRERRLVEAAIGDLEADLEFLMRAVRKVEAIREDLGKVGPVIADQVEEAMLGRRSRLDTRRAEADAEPVRKLFKFER